MLKTKGLVKATLLIFNFMWLGGLAFSNLGLFQIDTPSLKTNFVFVVAILSFNIVFFFLSLIHRKINKKQLSIDDVDIRIGFLSVVNGIIAIICVPYIIKAIHIIGSDGMTYLRTLVYEPSVDYFESTYIALFFQWIVQPFFQFVLLLTAIKITDFKNNKWLFSLALIDLIFDLILFGGDRRTIVMFLIECIVCYLCFKPHSSFNKKGINSSKIILFTFLVVALLVVYAVTSSRLTKISPIESFFQYYIGPYVFFDKVTLGSTALLTNSLGFGAYTFAFIFVLFSLVGVVFGKEYSTFSSSLNNLLSGIKLIGEHTYHNAHATSLIFFYSDFGYTFSFVGMIVFALILFFFVSRSNKSPIFLVLGLYFCALAFYSAQTYPFASVIQYVFILYALVFVMRKNYQLMEFSRG